MSIASERLKIARAEIGVKEVKGGENPRILEYHACTSLRAKEDEIPWCSAFVNWVMKQNGEVGTNLANARSWLSWGEKLKEPVEGCVVILKRGDPPAGHVGIFVGKEAGRIALLGGNQSDSVRISSFPESDVLEYRG